MGSQLHDCVSIPCLAAAGKYTLQNIVLRSEQSMMPEFDPKTWLSALSAEMREGYARTRRVMSFGEYMALLHDETAAQARSAAQYLRDVFDYFGTVKVHGPRGEAT